MHLIIVLLIALVGSIVFSGPWVITPKFKSWAVVYPANISPYSEESETEQMFQILQASYVRDQVIEKFNLAEHYDIAPDYKYRLTALLNEYRESVKISKTPGEAIKIEVFDKDPVIAKEMVETILTSYNTKVAMLHEEKFGEVVEMWERAIARKKAVIDSLAVKLRTLATEDGLIEYDFQANELVKGLLGTVEGGATRINNKEVAQLEKSIRAKGGELLYTLDRFKAEVDLFKGISHEYDRAYVDYDRQFSYTNIIETPIVADKKSTPVRWLIIALTMFATLFLALTVIGILENLRIRKAQK